MVATRSRSSTPRGEEEEEGGGGTGALSAIDDHRFNRPRGPKLVAVSDMCYTTPETNCYPPGCIGAAPSKQRTTAACSPVAAIFARTGRGWA
jgi:hypothetical protein